MSETNFPLPDGSATPAAPAFQKPMGLLTFSYTPQREQVFDNSAMKYYKDPPVNAPLDRE